MPMIPPLVRDPPPDDRQSSTARPVSGRIVRPQRRYASNFNISFEYEPPRPIPRPGVPAPASTFDKWRAAASELDPPGGGAGDPPKEAARGDAAMPGVAVAPRHTLHNVLLGTTAVVLLGVVGGIGYTVWSGALPGVAASPGGAAPKSSSFAAVVQPLVDLAAKAVPDRTAPPPPVQDGATDTPAPRPASQPTASLPLPSTAPNSPVLATPSADKPALTGPLPSLAPGSSAMAREAAPTPERVAAGPASLAKLSDPDAAAPTPAVPGAAAEAMPAPAPERATAAVVPPAKVPEPDTALAVPAVVAMTVRLPPAPEWTTAHPAALAGLPEAAALPSAPPALPSAPANPAPPAAAAVPDETAKVVPPGVDARQVVSTMELVQQMSLLVHDMHGEGLRYRTEVAALTGAVQAKASSLEERLKLAEARSVAGPGAEAGGPQGGLPGSGVAGEGGLPRAGAGTSPVLRSYRVQAGSPGAAVLSDAGAGGERAARLLVMVGDQLPGAGRVTAIVPRGGSWMVRTERGVIQ